MTLLFSSRYYLQQPHVRNAMNLGNRSMSDGLEIYKAMIEDTMQSITKELVEALDNYKVYRSSQDEWQDTIIVLQR